MEKGAGYSGYNGHRVLPAHSFIVKASSSQFAHHFKKWKSSVKRAHMQVPVETGWEEEEDIVIVHFCSAPARSARRPGLLRERERERASVATGGF